MTTPISAIAPISSISGIGAVGGVGATSATSAAGAASGTNFATALGNSLQQVSNAQTTASNYAIEAATGQLTDPAQYTVAATQATLMTQLAATIQSKAVTAFNTIMGMQA